MDALKEALFYPPFYEKKYGLSFLKIKKHRDRKSQETASTNDQTCR